MNLKETILGSDDLPIEPVDCPEWGVPDGTLFIRSLTGKQRDDFEQSMVTGRGKNVKTDMQNIRAKLVARCLSDKDSNVIFGPDDIEALGDKSAAALDRCFNIAQRMNGLTDQDVKELEGN